MNFSVGDYVAIENPATGTYDPPWGVGYVKEVGSYDHWEGWVRVEVTEGSTQGETHWYPSEAVQHID